MTESYCLACEEVVEGYPWTHEHEVHEGEDVDVKRIARTNSDGERITEPDDGMDHYGFHHFVCVEGRLVCPECGAINIDGGEQA
jgi:hypothetical protein